MRLHRIHLEQVRGVENCTVEFDSDGVTIVHAPNEAGKTTLLDAVWTLLEFNHRTTNQRVRALEPAGKNVGSVIEVELSVGDTHLVCRKQFNRDKSAVLEIVAPQRRTFTGDEAHDELRRILEANVDMTLLSSLWLNQGRALDAITLRSSTLSQRLDAVANQRGESVDIAAGDDLFARVAAEYDQYFTAAGKPKKDPLGQLDDALASAEATVTELDDRWQQFVADIDTLERIERELPQLEHELDHTLAPARERADEQFSQVEPLQAARLTAQAQLDTATARLESARIAWHHRTDQIAQRNGLQQVLDQLHEQLAPAQAQRDELEQARAEANRQVEAARAALEGAQQRRADADAARQAAERLAEREAVAKRLEDAQALTAQLDNAREQRRAITVNDATLDELRNLDTERRALLAAIKQTAATVDIVAHRDRDVFVDGASHHLLTGASLEHVVEASTQVELVGEVTITISAAASGQQLTTELDTVTDQLAQRCSAVGVADVGEAEQALTAARELDQRISALQHELRVLLGDDHLTDLQRQLDTLDTQLADAGTAAGVERSDGTDDPAAETLDKVIEQERLALQQLDDARTQLQAHQEALHASMQQHARELAQVEQTTERLQALDEQIAAARAQHADDALEAAVAQASASVESCQSNVEQIDAQLDELDVDQMQLVRDAARNAYENALNQRSTLRDERNRLESRLEVTGGSGLGEQRDQAHEQLTRIQREHRHAWQGARAAKHLLGELQAARDAMYERYRAPLQERIAKLASLLFGATVDVELGDELDVVARQLDGVRLEWAQLSAGTREQLAIVSALAAAQVAGDTGVPFILDDALGFSDPDRLQRIAALLSRTEGAQVIVLTCVAQRFQATSGRVVDLVAAAADTAST